MGEDELNAWTCSIKMPDGTILPFFGTIESVEVADMERKVKVGDRIKIIKPWMTQGRYEKGDVLTVRSVDYAGVWVVENDFYIDVNEYEIITDEIKPGDKVTLIDKPWEWDGWAQLDRKRRCAYGKMTGKEMTVCDIYQLPALVELRGIPCANTGVWFIPIAILRKVEPVKLPFDFEPEPVKEEPKRVQMTNEPHPEMKEGAKFVVVKNPDNPNLKIGDVLTLERNDGSKCPFFYHNDKMRCEWWKSLAPLEAKHRYTDEQITEAKCYLAEKMFDNTGWTITKPTEAHPVAVVSGGLGTGTAKCAPDDEFNAYIGLMVAFKRYHDDPLPTWIRG